MLCSSGDVYQYDGEWWLNSSHAIDIAIGVDPADGSSAIWVLNSYGEPKRAANSATAIYLTNAVLSPPDYSSTDQRRIDAFNPIKREDFSTKAESLTCFEAEVGAATWTADMLKKDG